MNSGPGALPRKHSVGRRYRQMTRFDSPEPTGSTNGCNALAGTAASSLTRQIRRFAV
jgi:hypothetical protein